MIFSAQYADAASNAESLIAIYLDANTMTLVPQTDDQVVEWIAAGNSIGAYIPPAPPLSTAQMNANLIGASMVPGNLQGAIIGLALQRTNAIASAVNAINAKLGILGNDVPMISQQQAQAALQSLMGS